MFEAQIVLTSQSQFVAGNLSAFVYCLFIFSKHLSIISVLKQQICSHCMVYLKNVGNDYAPAVCSGANFTQKTSFVYVLGHNLFSKGFVLKLSC